MLAGMTSHPVLTCGHHPPAAGRWTGCLSRVGRMHFGNCIVSQVRFSYRARKDFKLVASVHTICLSAPPLMSLVPAVRTPGAREGHTAICNLPGGWEAAWTRHL